MKKNKIAKQKGIKMHKDKAGHNIVLRFFAENPGKEMSLSHLMNKLKLKKVGDLLDSLATLETKNLIEKKSATKWKYRGLSGVKTKGKSERYEGIVDQARGGFAYILCKGLTSDVFVSAKNLGTAQDGDYVEVEIIRMHIHKPEGRISKILQRSKTQFVGVYRDFNNLKYVMVNSGNRTMEIFLDRNEKKLPKNFDRVVVEIIHWKDNPGDRYIGKITQNLGQETSIDIEMKSILANQGFSLEFSPAVMQEAKLIKESYKDLEHRRDFREISTFTIDPVDARDFDDALSIQRTVDDFWEVGVHIADVSYYVEPDSALDKEALKRGNSVYLVDRVLPMLPEKLSNELCSLRPHEDKMTFSVVFIFDEDFNIKTHWIGRTIIHSDRRFTYEEVQDIMDKGKGDFVKELNLLNKIAKHFRKERLKNGAIDFESDELRFKLDAQSQPLELVVKERKESHMLIEEFMLLANKYVASYISNKNKAIPIPFVYRIHDLPDPDKLEDFMLFAGEMGVKLDFSTPKKISKSLNSLANEIRKNDDLKILQPLAIRSMAKAEYSTDNIGHYGLAFDNYAHFTSPIRRYADLLVHRILFQNLHKEKRVNLGMLETQCRYISSQERKAMDAERESTKYFQILYMKKYVGKEFVARITGMNERGFFVELIETRCEGMISFDQMEQDIAVNKGRLLATSNYSDEKWRIGDKINVKVLHADPEDRELTLGIV